MSTAQQATHDNSGDAPAVHLVAATASPLPLSAPDAAGPAQVTPKLQHDSVPGHMQPAAAATTLTDINTQRAALSPQSMPALQQPSGAATEPVVAESTHDNSGDAPAVRPVAATASPLPLSAPDAAAPAQVTPKLQHDSVPGHMQPAAAATTLTDINTQQSMPALQQASGAATEPVVAESTHDNSGDAPAVRPVAALASPLPLSAPDAAAPAQVTLPGINAIFRRAVHDCAFDVLAARLQSSASYFDATISVELTSQVDTFKVSSANKESEAIFAGALQRSWTTHVAVIEDLMRRHASNPDVLEVLSTAFPNVGEPVVHPKGICVLYNPVTSHELDQRKSQTCKKLMKGWPDHLKAKVALLDLIPIFDSGKERTDMNEAERHQKALVNKVARRAIFTPYAVARIRHYAREAGATASNKFPVVLCVGKDEHKQGAIEALEVALSEVENVHVFKCEYHPAANQCAENTPTLNRFLNALNGVYAVENVLSSWPIAAPLNLEVARLVRFAMRHGWTECRIRTEICLKIGYADGRKKNFEHFVSGSAHGMDARILKFRELADEIYTMTPLQVAQSSGGVF